MDGYAYLVSYVTDKKEYFLKTIIPGRKANEGKNMEAEEI